MVTTSQALVLMFPTVPMSLSLTKVPTLSLALLVRKTGTERLDNWSQVAQLRRSRTKIQTQAQRH